MNILVCVKRVPATGAKIVLTKDEQEIETRHLGFTISPHEECAVEEAIRLKEAHGGTTTVLTLGPEAATEQLRFALAQGIDRAVLLETDGSDWGPAATAQAIVEAIRARPEPFDLLLFGNESADSGGYQVGIRVAYAFDLPCVTGIKALEIKNGAAIVKREFPGGWEVYETPLPAAFMVKEGLNLPRYPSLPGRLRAKKAPIEQTKPPRRDDGLEKVRLKTLAEQDKGAEILGRGPEAAPKVVEVLKRVGVL